MSYILEAIRRSEDERRKRLIPDVSTIHARSPSAAPRRSRLLHGLIAGSGLVLGVAGAAWLQTRWPDPPHAGQEAEATATAGEPAGAGDGPSSGQGIAAVPPRPQAPPVPASPQAPPVPSRPEAPPVPASRASPPVPERAAGADARGAGEAQPPPGRAVKPRTSRTPYSVAGVTPQATPPAAAPKVPPRAAALPPRPLMNSLPAAGADGGAPERAAMGGGEGAAGAPLAEMGLGAPAQPEFVSAVALRDLPDPVRQSLPDIVISLHRYATAAEARQVRVNGRAVREGDAVGTDLSVAEITRGGVVFTVGGQRFYMSAFQNWRSKANQ